MTSPGNRATYADKNSINATCHAENQDMLSVLPASVPAPHERTRLVPPRRPDTPTRMRDDPTLRMKHEETTGVPRRLVVLGMVAFALFLSSFFRSFLSTTVKTLKQYEMWSSLDTAMIFDSFVWGYVCTCVIGGYVSYRKGFKAILGLGVVVNSISTMLAPFAFGNLPMLIVLRVIAGAGEGVVLPAAYTMMSKWVPLNERARSVTLLWSMSFLGDALGSLWELFAENIERQLGYALIFIGLGVAGLLWFALWVWMVEERPEQHRGMSQRERRLILDSVPRPRPGLEYKTTWRTWYNLVCSWPVFALLMSHCAFSFSLYVYTQAVPTFLKAYHFYPVVTKSNEWFWEGLPYAALLFVALVGGWIADRCVQARWHPTMVRQVFQLSGTLPPTVLLILLSFVYVEATLVVTLTMIGTALLGLQIAGFATDVLDVAPAFSGVIVGVTFVAAAVPQVGSAFLFPWLVQKYFDTWNVPFISCAIVNVFGAVSFALFATGRRSTGDFVRDPQQENV